MLSIRFARGCSLSLGNLVSLNPLWLQRQECYTKESCGMVKGFPLGFSPLGLHLIVDKGS